MSDKNIPSDKITFWQTLNYSSVLDPSGRTHKLMWENQRLKFDGIPYFVLGQKIFDIEMEKTGRKLETKKKRNETAGIFYSVISNHNKFPKFFLVGGGGDKQHSSSLEEK